ncbi:MAG: hypothetical protein HGA23_01590 [Bacteroidales bacterium]|nr:hypothetical protein [Bacteroidales bacterium]
MFLTSWVVGNAVAIALAVAFAGKVVAPPAGFDLPWEGFFLLLLGIGLVIIAGISRRGRRRSEDPSAPPAWVGAVDDLKPIGGAFVDKCRCPWRQARTAQKAAQGSRSDC